MCAVCTLLFALSVHAAEPLTLHARSRTPVEPKSPRVHTTTAVQHWDAAKTALVVCDMWDKHWCPESTARVAELAPRVNAVAAAARARGSLIIHCPSDCLEFYKDTPQRKLAQSAPVVAPKVALQRWCKIDPDHEPPLPIDDSDGGCESPIKSFKAWTRQHPAIEIGPDDAITDSAEAYHLMRARGIENVAVMGVHTNMCVLGRPFAIRQLVKQGLNVVLVRDCTDTMYNPAKSPFVSHFTGTDLVVGHIETHWCPSVLGTDFDGKPEFRFRHDRRPHLAVIAAEDEYETERTLPKFAQTQLGHDFRVSFVYADTKDRARLPGLDVLDSADAVLVSVRRRPLARDDLERLRAFVAAGKPVVGVRTACHAFAPLRGQQLAAGVEAWADFDRAVLGCNYAGHHPSGAKAVVRVAPGVAGHPVLAGVTLGDGFASGGSLYKVGPLETGATELLTGRTADGTPAEPVAWTRERPGGGRVFCTTLGHPDDFANPNFVALLRNGIAWAARAGASGRPN